LNRAFFQRAIAQAAYQYQKDVEAERALVVGVNTQADPTRNRPRFRAGLFQAGGRAGERLRAARKKRDAKRWKASLEALGRAAQSKEALMPKIIDAVRARATVGEIADALRAAWGTYHAA